MGRTKNILGRVWKNLASYRIGQDKVLKTELLYDLEQAVKKIYTLVKIEKEISVTLVSGTSSYDLKLGTSIVSQVKQVIPPAGWTTKTIEIISQNEWNEALKSSLTGDYPKYGIIFGNKLLLTPTPGAGVDADIITLLCSTTGTDATIEFTDANAPDLPDIFDDALEYELTARNLSGKDKIEWINLFQNEIRTNRPAVHRKAGVCKQKAY